MKIFLLLLLILPVSALADDLHITPREVHDGEAFLVRLPAGEVSFAVLRWNDQPAYFSQESGGSGRLLLAVKSGQKPGLYPLLASVVDPSGRSHHYNGELKVVAANRPVERLTLPAAMVNPRKKEVLRKIEQDSQRLNEIYAQRSPALFWPRFQRPVNDPVGSPFGLRRILNGQPKAPHSGVDFRSHRGTPIASPGAGVVSLSDDLFYTGKTVVIDHGGGLISVLAHLQKSRVKPGEKVAAGQIVGEVGSSGRSTGPHLHWTVRLGGIRTDPLVLTDLLNSQIP